MLSSTKPTILSVVCAAGGHPEPGVRSAAARGGGAGGGGED